MKRKAGGLANLALIIGGLVVGLLIIELAGRPFAPAFDAGRLPVDYTQEYHGKVHYDRDPELGHVPRMGPEYKYSETGAKHNDYPLAKRPDWLRVMFLGDSITAIGYTGEHLKNKLAGQNIEFWNCGVTGYSTFQELRYYQRYCHVIKPDVMVLNFFLNDFDGTPVVLKNDQDQYVVITPYAGGSHFNTWLFKNSVLYRVYLSLRIALFGRQGLAEDVAKYLAELAGLGQRDNFRLKVVIYPWLDHFDQWPKRYREQYHQALEIMERLGLGYYDLRPLLDQALTDHPVEWTHRSQGDFVHPSKEFCALAADFLIQERFLDENGN
jgi:hypothetical protein